MDFVLGGHDHSYVTECDKTTGVFIIKSGTDFEEFNDFDVLLDATDEDYETLLQAESSNKNVTILYSKPKKMLVKIERVQIT